MTIWEYALIHVNKGVSGEKVVVYYWENNIFRSFKDFKSTHKVMEALHFLGKEGWELVGVGVNEIKPESQHLFLKRRVENT